MAGFIPVKELEARRRALVAESEVYRQTLLLEVMNIRLAGAKTRREMSDKIRPWLLVLAPLGALVGLWRERGSHGKGAHRKRGTLGKLLLVYRLYRRFGPLLKPWLAQVLAAFPAAAVSQQPVADPSPKPMNEQPV
jgi:hypothetical protein